MDNKFHTYRKLKVNGVYIYERKTNDVLGQTYRPAQTKADIQLPDIGITRRDKEAELHALLFSKAPELYEFAKLLQDILTKVAAMTPAGFPVKDNEVLRQKIKLDKLLTQLEK